MSEGPSRRNFIKASAIAGATLLLGGMAGFPGAASQGHPHSGSTGRSKKKWVMVIDTERCDGCRMCTEACIEEHVVPSGWGEPSFQGVRQTTKTAVLQKPEHIGRQEWIKVYNMGEDLGPPGDKGNFLPLPCMQCVNAPCVKVCPVNATYHNEDGLVLIDNNRCIGCRYCMTACPYERRFFNWGDPSQSYTQEERAKTVFAESSPEFPIEHKKGTVEKCMFCAHRVKFGKLPACVEACTKAGMKALFFGNKNEDVVSNGAEILKLSDLLKSRGAYRLQEDLGTDPNVYYLPPRGK